MIYPKNQTLWIYSALSPADGVNKQQRVTGKRPVALRRSKSCRVSLGFIVEYLPVSSCVSLKMEGIDGKTMMNFIEFGGMIFSITRCVDSKMEKNYPLVKREKTMENHHFNG